ncbi:MAG TPA: dihydrolipoamide acetyltransferase family protein [Bacillota bacterium]|nr:dihydrolipoamide acetyltransferase family protein [Bacillota bacterium]
MAIEQLTMPQLGESVTEGTIEKWLVNEGDHVNKYDPIAEIMTDKVNAEVPSSFEGTIKEIIAKEGTTIAVGDIMCTVEVEGEDTESKELKTSERSEHTDVAKAKDQSMKHRYSPAVLKLAQEHQIDLRTITGTGRGGRITRKDIEQYIQSSKDDRQPVQQPVNEQSVDLKKELSATGDIEIPVTGVRKVIAENMVRSKQEIPHAWMTVEVDVTDLVNYRQSVKEEFKENEGYNLTYFAFFVKAVAQALKEYPELNSTWAEDKIIQRKNINISIAVAKDNELYVPVIKQADDKSIKGIAHDIHTLAMKARNGQLTTDDMQGGTFTVNNTGSFGSIHSMGVINHPQAAILQVESIVKRPVIINDMFAARDMVNLSLSLDHRVLDGLICGKFLARVKELLERMNQTTINVY